MMCDEQHALGNEAYFSDRNTWNPRSGMVG